jgi:ABC-type uncharacterized transport system substrate-binding protein
MRRYFPTPDICARFETAAPTLGLRVIVIDAGNVDELESSMNVFARESDGLIVLPSSLSTDYHELIVSQANRHKLPAV